MQAEDRRSASSYRDVVTDEMQEGDSKVVRTALSRANWSPRDFSAVQVIEKLAERVGLYRARCRKGLARNPLIALRRLIGLVLSAVQTTPTTVRMASPATKRSLGLREV